MSDSLTFERWLERPARAVFNRVGNLEAYCGKFVAAAAEGNCAADYFYLPAHAAKEALAARGNNVIHIDFTGGTPKITR